jgi:hypothetical protein
LFRKRSGGHDDPVLDRWHWYHAGDGATDIQALRNEDVVAWT